jgi:N-acetylglucosamine transport system substrate-binding protein
MKKWAKFLALAGMASTIALVAAGCGSSQSGASSGKTLNVAALQGGYGKTMYTKVIKEFEKENPGVKVKLTISKSIEDEITPNMKAGKYPDLVVLGQGRQAGLTESLIKDHQLEDVTSVLNMKVPGEKQTVKQKLIPGIIDNLGTNPYGGDKTYLMPMYYAPTGLVYNEGLLKKEGWAVPTTWDEFYALGDKAKAKGISLFTYPTSGYFDSYFYSSLATAGGKSFFNNVMNYKKDIWKSATATKVLDNTGKLLTKYVEPSTVGNANEQDFSKNQQLILDNKAVFMPNGTWIVTEMGSAPRAKRFKWGMMPTPAVKKGDKRYITTSVESSWIPKKAVNKTLAKKFMAFLYSDKAADIFVKSDAVQPINGMAAKVSPDLKEFYNIYKQSDVEAVVGGFASTKPVEGVNIKETMFNTVDSIVSKKTTVKQWQDKINTVSNKLNAAKE